MLPPVVWLPLPAHQILDIYCHYPLVSEQETQRWRLGTGIASGGPRFQTLSIAKKSPFLGSLGAKHVHGGSHFHWNQSRW